MLLTCRKVRICFQFCTWGKTLCTIKERLIHTDSTYHGRVSATLTTLTDAVFTRVRYPGIKVNRHSVSHLRSEYFWTNTSILVQGTFDNYLNNNSDSDRYSLILRVSSSAPYSIYAPEISQ